MKLKRDDKGAIVSDGEKPIFVDDTGKEIIFDYDHTIGHISRLNGEAKGHREAKQALEERLKAYEGIDDPDAARSALELAKNIDSKKLLDAGKVDEIKAEATRAYDEKLKALKKEFEPVLAERDNLKNQLDNEIIGGSFSRSKFIADKLAIPADLVQAAFGKAFELRDGKPIAKDASGNEIYSRAKPGEIAGFEEALEILVDKYPNRDTILKGSGASGGGAGGTVHNTGGRKTMTRTAFAGLDPVEQASVVKDTLIVD